MSDRERAIHLLEDLPEYKMSIVVAYLQGLIEACETEDDAYCNDLYQNYLNDSDPHKHDTVSIDDLAANLGVII